MAETLVKLNNLEELLRPYLLSYGNKKLTGYKTKLLNEPGENYGSLMLSIDAEIENEDKINKENLQMVAKICPPNEWLKRMFACDITFKKEIQFYKNMVPTLIQFQKDHNISKDKYIDNLIPQCINGRISLNPSSNIVDENAILLLENLKTKGYTSGDRLIGMNLEETTLVVKDLARFHAIILAYKLLKPINFQNYILPMLNKVNIGQEMFDTAAHRFTDSISGHLNLSKEELKRFIAGMDKGMNFQKHFPPGNEKYSTAIHRDFWTNNTMIFRDSNNKPIKNKLLDFQVLAYGSPATDLIFLLYSSVILSVLEKHYDHFIATYHSSLIECLQEFSCNISEYTLDSFKKEIEIYGPLEVSHILIMFRAIYAKRGVVPDMKEFNIDEMFNNDYVTDIYKTRLIWTVKHFLDKNWF